MESEPSSFFSSYVKGITFEVLLFNTLGFPIYPKSILLTQFSDATTKIANHHSRHRANYYSESTFSSYNSISRPRLEYGIIYATVSITIMFPRHVRDKFHWIGETAEFKRESGQRDGWKTAEVSAR